MFSCAHQKQLCYPSHCIVAYYSCLVWALGFLCNRYKIKNTNLTLHSVFHNTDNRKSSLEVCLTNQLHDFHYSKIRFRRNSVFFLKKRLCSSTADMEGVTRTHGYHVTVKLYWWHILMQQWYIKNSEMFGTIFKTGKVTLLMKLSFWIKFFIHRKWFTFKERVSMATRRRIKNKMLHGECD